MPIGRVTDYFEKRKKRKEAKRRARELKADRETFKRPTEDFREADPDEMMSEDSARSSGSATATASRLAGRAVEGFDRALDIDPDADQGSDDALDPLLGPAGGGGKSDTSSRSAQDDVLGLENYGPSETDDDRLF